MKYQTFSEYLDRNNKLKTSGMIKQIADFEGTVDTKPGKENKHKDAGGKGQDGEIKPYKGGVDGKDPNKGKLGDGFAYKGDSKLKYEPNVPVQAKAGEGGTKTTTWPKTKTQEWVDRTKNMSLAEFTKTVRSETLKGLDECSCQESPHNSIKELVSICQCNQKYVSSLVREMKRNGLFGKLVKEMVNHPETFKALAVLMESDEIYARKLAKAMNEMVAPPMGDEHDGNDIGGPPMHKMKKKKSNPMDMGGMGDDDMGDDDMGDDDMGDDDMGDDDMGDDDMGDDMGDDDMGDDMGDDDMGDDDMGDDDMGDDDMGDDDMGDDDMGDDINMKMPPKKKSHQNIMAAMKDHPGLMK